MNGNRTTELLPCPWCEGEAYFAEGENAFDYVIECHHKEGCAVGDWPNPPYDRKSIVVGDLDCCSDDREKAIAAWNARAYLNPDGLPVGLTLSEDGMLLNWRGENYVRQSGTLTAEQVRETVEKHWHDLPAEYDMPEATALPEYSYDWQAIADELNRLGSGTCKNTAPEYLDFLCSECGFVHYHSDENDSDDGNDWAFCPRCGKAVER